MLFSKGLLEQAQIDPEQRETRWDHAYPTGKHSVTHAMLPAKCDNT